MFIEEKCKLTLTAKHVRADENKLPSIVQEERMGTLGKKTEVFSGSRAVREVGGNDKTFGKLQHD